MNVDIHKINSVIASFFLKNPAIHIVPVKDLMPDFIAAGIFKKDHKKGKPIRDVLRALDREGKLNLIPYVHPERKDQNTYWYFISDTAIKPTSLYKQAPVSAAKVKAQNVCQQSDESYLIDLCDVLLNQAAQRQFRFPFLLGDVHKDGKSRTQLPVDAYYQSLNLVIEYKESQHSLPIDFFDKQDVTTVSGVSRGEQRKIYDERRRVELPKRGIQLIEISYDVFDCDSQKKIIRNAEHDLKKIEVVLRAEGIEVGE